LGQIEPEMLKELARKYVWWKSPDEALRFPQRIIAQVMNMGAYDDVHLMATQLGHDAMCEALQNAVAGQFDNRSWTYWHYRLGLAGLGEVPPLPSRTLP